MRSRMQTILKERAVSSSPECADISGLCPRPMPNQHPGLRQFASMNWRIDGKKRRENSHAAARIQTRRASAHRGHAYEHLLAQQDLCATHNDPGSVGKNGGCVKARSATAQRLVGTAGGFEERPLWELPGPAWSYCPEMFTFRSRSA